MVLRVSEIDTSLERRTVADHHLQPEALRAIEQALDSREEGEVRSLVKSLHPADVADLFEQISSEQRRRLARVLGEEVNGAVLAELNETVRDEILSGMPATEIAKAVAEMDTDDAVALVEELHPDEQGEVLDNLETDHRTAIESALSYPEDSAGRLMQRDVIAVPEHWTVGDVIDFLRVEQTDLTDFWEIFVVSPDHKPIGTMRLSWVLTTPRWVPVSDVMQRQQTLIPVTMDQEEVALRFQKYALISAAVISRDGRLQGVITVDDVVDVVAEEASEDMLRLSGAGDSDIFEPVFSSFLARIRWLAANLITGVISASIIAAFGATIEKMVVLAALSPIVASIGGNTGNQTMAVIVRALATGHMTNSNTARVIARQSLIALLNGVTIALLLGIGVAIIFQDLLLGGVIATATIFNLLIAGLAGVLVPLGFKRVGVDPAVASSVFVTMITDSMGFFLFLGLASASGLVA